MREGKQALGVFFQFAILIQTISLVPPLLADRLQPGERLASAPPGCNRIGAGGSRKVSESIDVTLLPSRSTVQPTIFDGDDRVERSA